MSQNAGLAKRHTNDSDAHIDPARPKVMRRPSHFSSTRPAGVHEPVLSSASLPSPAAEKIDPAPNLAAPLALHAPAHHTHSKLWQDDARFGVAMILIVVLTNIGLMLWLPHIRPLQKQLPAVLTVIESDAPTVQPERKLGAPVTLYTNPSPPVEEPAVHVLGEATADVEQ